MARKLVNIYVVGPGEDLEFEGRLLGLIGDKEFGILLSKPELWKKVSTQATVPLTDILLDYDAVEHMRIVVTIKELKDRTTPYNRLWISPKISYVSSVNASQETDFTCSDGSLVALKEVS